MVGPLSEIADAVTKRTRAVHPSAPPTEASLFSILRGIERLQSSSNYRSTRVDTTPYG